ncbi:MAG: LysR family transcriptional regulator [Burkholderia sp.]|jgi:DNA-binding transcriptional LysR family regulator|uniref:LysR family transcriptional regulator n=3 Tax=Burkholderiales TaxID=80840 RepID=UPI0025895CC5|nr:MULTISPECIES: LysR family transcriptional regulator [Burkholderiaceae]MCA3194087.1 LysR family transcriptional regulator [Cupriavidus sp.]MCA3778085.1 LysR family transcriptional regulator [Burkholderia sp.]MCA3795909.1 LysR family transcriptional regulator [Burkholderia sp.]MCA3817265.1 LysR family transcriptional regulator [Burkholderia sp.]MCA3832371.1 LysR family transcriptional regulator [Burkholderia sp.]
MRSTSLRTLDLNLLHAFSVLMEEQNVSRAAERLYIGQPGLSSALRRLRDALGDELFVRVGRGLQPTPRALAIAPEIADALATIERAVQPPESFDPATWHGEFRVGMCDNFEMAFFGTLTARIRELAPHARVVAVASTKRDSVQLLEKGAYDFSVAVHGEPASWHIRESLFDQRLVCLYDPNRLHLPANLSVEDYSAAQHVIVSSGGSDTTALDDFLNATGVKRNVIAGVSRYSAVAPVLQAVPAVATVPETVAHCMARLYGLQVCVPPLDFPVEPISMLYRKTDFADGRAIWFRRLFTDVATTALHASRCQAQPACSTSMAD